MVITNYLDMIWAAWNKSSEGDQGYPLFRAGARCEDRPMVWPSPKGNIIEYLAGCQLKIISRGPIICLVGPPG